MSFVNFLLEHWSSILAVLVLLVALFFLVKKGYKKYAKQIVFYLVCKAEEEFGSGTGTLKYAAVTTWLYEKLPAVCKFFFTQKQIDKMIEEAVSEMKEWLNTDEKAVLTDKTTHTET